MQSREQAVVVTPLYEVISDSIGRVRRRAWDKPKNTHSQINHGKVEILTDKLERE